jgi:hypothetical protein
MSRPVPSLRSRVDDDCDMALLFDAFCVDVHALDAWSLSTVDEIASCVRMSLTIPAYDNAPDREWWLALLASCEEQMKSRPYDCR